MPTAQTFVTLQKLEPKLRAETPIGTRGFGAHALDWVMKTQKQRAARLIQQHPEWRAIEEE